MIVLPSSTCPLTRVRRSLARDEGSAIVEVVFLAVLLFVPLVYLVVVLSAVQSGEYAASASAREAGRLFVTSPTGEAAFARAHSGARTALDGFGVEGRIIGIDCSANPCLTPQAKVRIRTQVRVPLPLIPAFMAGAVPTSITIDAVHDEQVDRFREPRP